MAGLQALCTARAQQGCPGCLVVWESPLGNAGLAQGEEFESVAAFEFAKTLSLLTVNLIYLGEEFESVAAFESAKTSSLLTVNLTYLGL